MVFSLVQTGEILDPGFPVWAHTHKSPFMYTQQALKFSAGEIHKILVGNGFMNLEGFAALAANPRNWNMLPQLLREVCVPPCSPFFASLFAASRSTARATQMTILNRVFSDTQRANVLRVRTGFLKLVWCSLRLMPVNS